MSLEERENYSPEDQYFQDDETRDEDNSIDAPPADHSVSDNAEPDYGDDFSNQELNENPDNDELNDDPEEDEDDEELEDDDNLDEEDDLQDDDFDKESLEDEEYTDPSRQL